MSPAISPLTVRTQLRKILLSEGFVRSRRMQRFLEFIVEETLAGRGDQLGEYCIGMAVFDRAADFEPALDPIVRVDARRLRVKLLEYYSHTGLRPPDEVIIHMPKGGYNPVFALAPPNGENRVPPSAPPLRLSVLPFEALSTEPEIAMFSRALCMSLTVNFTNLEGLEAIAHNYFSEQSIRETALALNLTHVIHGSILKSSQHYRAFINLIQVPEGRQIWAGEYDFETSELLTVQSAIRANVLQEVTVRLGLQRLQPNRLHLAA